MVKIHIIGGPGSGKTTLAKELSSRLHIPHYDLDKVDLHQEHPLTIAKQSAWITEGIYLIVTEPMLYYADYIIWLEVSWPLAGWRIVYRHFSNSLRGTQSYPGINGLKLLCKLLKDSRRYYLNQSHAEKSSVELLHKYLETHQKIIDPPTEEFVDSYIEANQEMIIPPTAEFVRGYLDAHYKEKVFPIKNTTERERLLELLLKS